MGQFTSKLLQDILEPTDQPVSLIRPGTPIHTPRHKILEFDPRSPSEEISRTPIVVESTPDQGKGKTTCEKRNILKSTYVKSYLETDFDEPIECNMSEKKHILFKKCIKVSNLQDSDPRSPTVGIDRTPIQVGTRLVDQESDVATKILPVASYLETDMDMLLKEPTPGNVEATKGEDKNNKAPNCDPPSSTVEVSRTSIPVVKIPDQKKVAHKHFEPYIHHDEGAENATETNVDALVAGVLELMQDGTGEIKQQKNTPLKAPQHKIVTKRIIFKTPDSKCASPNTGLGFKVRMPLGARSANDNSPHQLLRIRQARGMHQEIDRLSIVNGNENTPPLSMCQNVAVPEIRKKQVVDWDNNDTTVII